MQDIRHNWKIEEVVALFSLPFNDLLYMASTLHRRYFNPNQVQLSTLLSIKTGGCPEDCSYCPQSAHYTTGLEKETLLQKDTIIAAAQKAQEAGASRFCMGAAWRSLNERDMPKMEAIIEDVKALGLEVCVTLGMATTDQLKRLKQAGLDYYNHNIDTSPEHYERIITTRTFNDRLQTLSHIRDAGLNTCCGGIVGLGETLEDRAEMLRTLANLPGHPESVPINRLVPIAGTPLADVSPIDDIDFVRTIAIARIMMPASYVRLSAGRETMDNTMQALCFFAGANSIFYGETLLTAPNPEMNNDTALFKQLGITPLDLEEKPGVPAGKTCCA